MLPEHRLRPKHQKLRKFQWNRMPPELRKLREYQLLR
jgi:hypothetical protein